MSLVFFLPLALSPDSLHPARRRNSFRMSLMMLDRGCEPGISFALYRLARSADRGATMQTASLSWMPGAGSPMSFSLNPSTTRCGSASWQVLLDETLGSVAEAACRPPCNPSSLTSSAKRWSSLWRCGPAAAAEACDGLEALLLPGGQATRRVGAAWPKAEEKRPRVSLCCAELCCTGGAGARARAGS